ncbi:MAG: nitronate monooxygenase [Spirochaetaceae bacterium]|nr:nitronate monooxygenase [Spirochaetaceae bacterium]
MELKHFDTLFQSLKTVSDDLVQSLSIQNLSKLVEEVQQSKVWKPLQIGNHIAKTPIVQGGMGVGISLSSLASAVANNGGIGVIAANGIGLLEKDYYKDGLNAGLNAFRKEIRKARELTKGIIGVNIMVALKDFHEMLDVAIQEKVDIVFMGAGLPIKNIPVKRLRENNISIAPIVSSSRAANLIFKMWTNLYNDVPDAVVFEGPKAGGHLGFTEEQLDKEEFQLEYILPSIVEVLKPYEKKNNKSIPVIAGGGVFTGSDIKRILDLGASGVQMATRFVATDECDANIKFKEAYVNCKKEDIGLIKSPVGMPGRAIRNQFIIDSENGKRPDFKCAWKCLATCKAQDANYCISIALNNARLGHLNSGYVFCGETTYRIKEIVSVASLIEELKVGYLLEANKTINGKFENLVTKSNELWGKYKDLVNVSREKEEDYECALRKLPQASHKALRDQYQVALSSVIKTQLQLVETVSNTWNLLKNVTKVQPLMQKEFIK